MINICGIVFDLVQMIEVELIEVDGSRTSSKSSSELDMSSQSFDATGIARMNGGGMSVVAHCDFYKYCK